MAERMTGVVKVFFAASGYGLLTVQGQPDLYISAKDQRAEEPRRSNYLKTARRRGRRTLTEGKLVHFTLEQRDGRPYAADWSFHA
jgi:cold shock CspA family protein